MMKDKKQSWRTIRWGPITYLTSGTHARAHTHNRKEEWDNE